MTHFTDLQQRIIVSVNESIDTANEFFGESLLVPEVRFDLRGKSAGQARFETHRTLGVFKKTTSVIRFNRLLMEENPQAFVDEVAPHEAAHVIANAFYGNKIKPHGREWKMIMQTVLNQVPEVTHKFDVSRVSRKSYLYHCKCPDLKHELSAIRHHRIERKQSSYLCRKCNSQLNSVSLL